MKITWDNLERCVYLPKNETWRKGHNHYIYAEHCISCGEPFLHRTDKEGFCCSTGCSNKNRVYSKQHRQKISKALTGRICSKETRIKISKSHKGKTHSIETRKKLSEINKDKILSKTTRMKMSKRMKGKNNPNWKNGISCEPYCKIWLDSEYKESIRERDNHQCQNPYCHGNINPNRFLSIHHINYNKKDCHPNNLITLCVGCNNRANKDREWHTAWYGAVIYNKQGIINNSERI